MGMLVFLSYIYLISNIPATKASTHWLVTEDGRIQGQQDSLFNLRRPYDLVALLKQEQRAMELENLKEELLARKEEIDRNEDKDTGLEQRFYKTDKDCITAGKPLPEFDLYISTVLPLENKGIRPEEHIDFKAPPTTSSAAKAPFCAEFMELHYSLHAFEHLEGIKERQNLTGSPELGLKNAITHRDNVDDYGHLIYEALKKNNTSWVLYNMAAFYWRIKGDPLQVIECLRRALHFSPRAHKDVALISLANVLHRSRYSHEAAVVVHAALDVSKELNVNHFTLGNIYAVLAEYNKSVICFENTLKIQPDFEAAAKRKHAVLCHAKLEEALEMQHRSLQRTLAELRDYQRKHEYWQAQNERLINEQASVDFKYEQRVAYDQLKVRESAVSIGEFCQVVEQNGRNELECSWGRKTPIINDLDFGWTDTDENDSYDETSRDGQNYREPVRPPLYNTRRQPTAEEDEKAIHKDKEWPNKDECDTYVQKFPAYNEYPTTYLPAENKGFEVKALLTEAQGLKKGMQHPLPWYPPTCIPLANIPESNKAFDHVTAVKERDKVPDKMPDRSMKSVLLDLVENQEMTEEEVGQRILTALKKRIGPTWVLYNLAGLYWRIVGNNKQGIECLRRALFFSPEKYKDVPLVNLASVLYKWGRIDDTVTVMREAVNINDLEPETHFFLGNMLAAKGNLTGSIWHYNEALNQNPTHQQAFTMLRNLRCYEKFHRSPVSPVPKEPVPRTPAPSPGGCGTQTTGVSTPKPTTNVKCQNHCQQQQQLQQQQQQQQQQKCNCCCPQQQQGATAKQIDNKSNPKQQQQQQNDKVIPPDAKPVNAAKSTKSESATPQTSKKKVNGDESCVVETQGSAENCAGGSCKQTCTVTPVKVESCADGTQATVEGTTVSSNGGDTSGSNKNNVDSDFNERLDEVSEYYRDKGVCEGKECHRLLLQNSASTQKPHTRLEIINGVLHQKLIFVESPSDIDVTEHECIIFNDGSKSAGCTREEFRTFDIEELQKYISQSCGSDFGIHGDDSNSNPDNQECTMALSDIPSVDLASPTTEQQREPVESAGDHVATINTKTTKLKVDLNKRMVIEIEGTNIKDRITIRTVSLADEDIIKNNPDPLRHIYVSRSVPWPTWDECKEKYRPFNFKQFMSSWVSVSTKNIDIKKHINFDEDLDETLREEPICDVKYGKKAELLEAVQGVKDPSQLDYKPEAALKEILQKLGGATVESVELVGTRISRALARDPASWVAANLAALYWRINGDAQRTIDCVKVAYANAPRNARDISLLSLTNVLHQSGLTDAAILANNMALEASPKIVGLHFSMANLYAAREEWGRATRFYEATLGLQARFQPAKDRLLTIQCEKVLSNPHIYKHNPK